jgi:hypothetical protein
MGLAQVRGRFPLPHYKSACYIDARGLDIVNEDVVYVSARLRANKDVSHLGALRFGFDRCERFLLDSVPFLVSQFDIVAALGSLLQQSLCLGNPGDLVFHETLEIGAYAHALLVARGREVCAQVRVQ